MSIKPIEAKIISVKGADAILEINKQTISLATCYLPETLREGKTIKLYFLASNEISLDKKLAKITLEEILNGK